MSLQTLLAIIALALLALVILDFVRCYRKSTSAGWQRVWDAGRGSATIVWQQLGLVAAALVTAGDKLTDWICQMVNAPGADDAIKGAISSYVTPTSVGAVTALYIAVTIWARARTLGKG